MNFGNAITYISSLIQFTRPIKSQPTGLIQTGQIGKSQGQNCFINNREYEIEKSPRALAALGLSENIVSENYSAFGASSATASAAGASATGASPSALEDLRERRVAFFFVAVLAMFSSKSTSSMKQIGAASP